MKDSLAVASVVPAARVSTRDAMVLLDTFPEVAYALVAFMFTDRLPASDLPVARVTVEANAVTSFYYSV